MKQKRKEELLLSFPVVPSHITEQMQGRYAANFAVFLTHGDELYVRCFHRYFGGNLVERQRYVFAKDGAVRYGKKDEKLWTVRTEFREPVFCQTCYGYNFDNTYKPLNLEAISRSWMKYCCVELYHGGLEMEYLRLYCKHPNVEYIMKSGFGCLIGERCTGYWGGIAHIAPDRHINWKSNNLLKMLGLNRDECKVLRDRASDYEIYMMWRDNFPKYKPDELLILANQFHYEVGTAQNFTQTTGLSPVRIARYLGSQSISNSDYSDYLRQCINLKYNLHDTAISMPRDFIAMHTRLSELVEYQKNEKAHQAFMQNMEMRERFCFSSGGLMIRQPNSMAEIIAEGKRLHHCVGGYAERHAYGKLHILFIRTAEKPNVPFYTMEVSLLGEIVQVRGLRNTVMTDAVKAFVEEYKQHLAGIFGKQKRRKTA